MGVEHALLFLESVMEFEFGLWMANLDLRKAFDKIHVSTLFAALHRQGLPEESFGYKLGFWFAIKQCREKRRLFNQPRGQTG